MSSRFAAIVTLAALSTPAFAQTPQLLGDLRPGSGGSRPSSGAVSASLGKLTVFNADDGATGVEPWVSDGTAVGTFQLADLRPGPESSTPRNYFAIGGRLVFSAYLPGIGEELAVTDGTAAGTGMLVDIRPGIANSNPRSLLVYRGELLLLADDGSGERVWRTDGTPAGTYAHPVLPPGFRTGLVAGNKLFWFARNGTQHELWCWDGISLPAIVTSFAQQGSASAPRFVAAFRDRSVFVAPSATSATSLWSSDGTPGGTIRIEHYADPRAVEVGGDKLICLSSASAPAVWATDGTVGGKRWLFTASSGTTFGFFRAHDRVYFPVWITAYPFPPVQTWVTDGTPAGTRVSPLPWISGLVEIGSRRFAYVRGDMPGGAELWTSDGTSAGARREAVLHSDPGLGLGGFADLRYHGGRIHFWVDDSSSGAEPYALHLGAGVQSVGIGCSDGVIPTLRANDPVFGGSVDFEGSSGPSLASGFVALAPAPTRPILVFAECDLHISFAFEPVLLPFITDATGAFVLPSVPVPFLPALNGYRIGAQAAILSPGAPALGFAVSNGLMLTLGR